MNLLAQAAPLGGTAPAAFADPLVFGALALAAVVTALVVVVKRNVVVAALFLVLHLLTVAGLYVLLNAYFLAALQVIVYAGAILVLVIFTIMLLNLDREARGGPGTVPTSLALALAVALVFLLARATKDFNPVGPTGAPLPADPDFGSVARIGDAMFGAYFFPFEVVSLVLVAAMIGAIVLAKRHLEG